MLHVRASIAVYQLEHRLVYLDVRGREHRCKNTNGSHACEGVEIADW